MQTQMLEKDAHRAKFKVSVPAEAVTDTYERVLRELARQVRVPGFRPGKAPRGVIEARVGKDAVAQEVRDALVRLHLPQAVRELSLTPIAQRVHAHEPVEGEAYSFEVDVELYPEVTLPELSEIVIDTEKPPLTEEMVQEAIENLQRQHATLIPVERPAEAGDHLVLELAGGEEGSTLPVDLDAVSPAFAEQLYGKAIGDEVEVTLDQPDENEAGEDAELEAARAADTSEEPAAVDAETDANTGAGSNEGAATPPTLRVVIKDIKAKELPERGDEFAQTLGFATWAEVEARVRESLAAQLEQEAFSAQREEFTEKLTLESNPHVPQSLKERRKAVLLQNLARDLEGRGLSMQAYLEKLDQEEKRAEFEAELEEAAENAVKRDLVLEKLLETRGTRLSDAEFEAALAFMAQQQGSTPAKLRQELGEQGLANYRFLLTRDKAVRESLRELLGADADAETAPETAVSVTSSGAAEDASSESVQ
ncbi:trigger factor [Truepera radiovictrix]|uniref:Trigger factor n=1 Tax=Truepera radiovictrix (strain DSM 17093 / CIP 108686 / LMG 22925 / RQ-24) TaxID=649638 RepID=D7CSW3_TRURR|nr:trigger factor [Truepera radiovictrix]ADI13730.1 trigger factor [Truepera radiovictrix DSM 17093]WMT57705.1 trigger factor [Truepera radiovictrix]